MSDTAAAPEVEPEVDPEAPAPLEGLDAFLAETDEEDLDLDLQDEDPVVEPEPQEPEPAPVEPASEPAAAPPVEPEPTGEPAPPAVPEPAPVPAPQEAAPAPETVAPPAPVEPQPVQQPQAPQQTPEEAQAAYAKYRGEAEAVLAKEHYAISPEMAENLDENAAEVIPQLMSKVYMDAVSGAISHVLNQMPALVDGAIQARESRNTQETQFFGAWPQLDPTQHRETVVSLGQAYRQVHPTASVEQFIRDVGAQAVVALQLQPQAVAPPAAAPVQEAAPAPFRPAGSSPPSSSPSPPTNRFESLNAEFDMEDLDLD